MPLGSFDDWMEAESALENGLTAPSWKPFVPTPGVAARTHKEAVRSEGREVLCELARRLVARDGKRDAYDFDQAFFRSLLRDRGNRLTHPFNLKWAVDSGRRPPPVEMLVELGNWKGVAWIAVGKGRYRLVRLDRPNLIDLPRPGECGEIICIPDLTPSWVARVQVQGMDEQSVLTKIRYSRVIDRVLGFRVHQVQPHYKNSAKGLGSNEVDELYVDETNVLVLVSMKKEPDKLSLSQFRALNICAADLRTRSEYRGYQTRSLALSMVPRRRHNLIDLFIHEISPHVDIDKIRLVAPVRCCRLELTDVTSSGG